MSRYIDMDTAIAIVDAVRFGQPVSRLCEMLEVSREEIERLPGFPSVCFPRGDVEINYFAEEMQDAVICLAKKLNLHNGFLVTRCGRVQR